MQEQKLNSEKLAAIEKTRQMLVRRLEHERWVKAQQNADRHAAILRELDELEKRL